MDRILLKMMRERGIRKGLIEKVEEMLGETSCKVKVGGREGGCENVSG